MPTQEHFDTYTHERYEVCERCGNPYPKDDVPEICEDCGCCLIEN